MRGYLPQRMSSGYSLEWRLARAGAEQCPVVSRVCSFENNVETDKIFYVQEGQLCEHTYVENFQTRAIMESKRVYHFNPLYRASLTVGLSAVIGSPFVAAFSAAHAGVDTGKFFAYLCFGSIIVGLGAATANLRDTAVALRAWDQYKALQDKNKGEGNPSTPRP